jgi:hypothetical protein
LAAGNGCCSWFTTAYTHIDVFSHKKIKDNNSTAFWII